jgi:hypothetical protein
MARQILVGANAHTAALELLKAGHLDSNPVALDDGAFEVSLKPEMIDALHFAEVQKLLNDPALKRAAPEVSNSAYCIMVLVGEHCYEMAEALWRQGGSLGENRKISRT